jgi:hypothetical protein
VLFDAVVAKDKKDREAVKRMAAEEQREEMVTVLGAPAPKRQAKKRAAPAAKKTPAEKAAAAEAKAAAASGGEGHALWEMQGNEEVHARAHLRARAGTQVLQGVRRQRPLRARAATTQPMRGLRRQRRLRARAAALQVQGLRRQQLLRTRAGAQQVQGLRRRQRGSICEHDGRVRSNCKGCGGGNICEHGRERRYCKDLRRQRPLRARAAALQVQGLR